MPNSINAECPKCGKKAKTLCEIEEKFGFRFLEDISIVSNYDGWVKPSKMKKIGEKTKPQSNCRDCRTGKSENKPTSSRRGIRLRRK